MSDGSSEPVTPEAWEQALAAEFAAFMKETRAAMNTAREGHWIADTEEVVREAGERLRQPRRAGIGEAVAVARAGWGGGFFPRRTARPGGRTRGHRRWNT